MIIKKCRLCNNTNLIDLLSLGNIAVSDFLDSEVKPKKSPLNLILCDPNNNGCGLVQLKNRSISPDLLYRQYWYRSGVNKSMCLALENITDAIIKIIDLNPGDIVVDVGANDGTLLRSYKNEQIVRIGFEPAINLISEAKAGGNIIVNNYFNYDDFKQIVSNDRKAKVITTVAMFYDLEDPNHFVDDINRVLDNDGIWVNQLSYLPSMLETVAFDNICHEHVEYYSLNTIKRLLDSHSLEIFDVEKNDVNGGSFRIYVKKQSSQKNFPASGYTRVKYLLKKEAYLNDHKTYLDFYDKTNIIKKTIKRFIKTNVAQGRRFYVYGASTKGNTFLQYLNLNNKLISKAADRNPGKWGKKTVATNIPIISEQSMREEKPDYLLVLPWHFKDEFIQRETEYLKSNGKMLFPLPTPTIVEYKNNKIQIKELII